MVPLRYGKWTVVSVLSFGNPFLRSKAFVKCLCDCGTTRRVKFYNLFYGLSTSCGCQSHESRCTHGQTRNGKHSREYRVWCNIVARCTNPDHKNWEQYGGRGITVCERWLDFQHFYEDVGPIPKGLTVDRTDNDRGYGPDNFRLVTMKVQSNNRRNNRLLTYKGETKTMTQWAESIGMPVHTFKARLYRGWTVEEAIETPLR